MANVRLTYLDDFLLHIQTHNYSEETLYNYERDLAVFGAFLDELGCDFPAITKKVIEQYKAYLTSRDRRTANDHVAEKKLGSGSVNRTLSSLRAYIKFLIEMDYPTPLPPEAIRLIRTEKKHPQVAELNELVRLIEAPSSLEMKKNIALRNRAIMEVLFSTGMRISELVSIRRVQIDNTGRIFIRGKGKKERFVYLTPRAHQHIRNYLSTRGDANPNLFIPYRGMNVSSSKARISTNYVQERIKHYRELLGINIPISAHSLRHGFATYLAESGANPAAIQILLGHESLDTTTRYVHASDRYAEKTHQTYHPLKK